MTERAPKELYRLLPAVDQVLSSPEAASWLAAAPRELVLACVRAELERWRAEIGSGATTRAELERRLAGGELVRGVAERLRRDRGLGIRPAINATGVVLHTGLGRAPLHPEVAEAMAAAARGYCVLEVDRWSGARNHRDERVGELLGRLVGCEAAIAVNNNAAAVLLLLSTFAAGKQTVLSRGELVEIGGSFRMPDVMERAGTELVEVGTTNRTRLADYRAALSPRTGLLMKVHRSNFRVEGFVEEVEPTELAALAVEHDLPSAYDLGSGLVELAGQPTPEALAAEPRVGAALASGVDVVAFSGDKLFGGPQAGLLAGRAGAIGALRANPLYRALRLDKVALAGLERTLDLYVEGRGAELPARTLLALTRAELVQRAESLRARLAELPALEVSLADDASRPGSGSAPGVELPTCVVVVAHSSLSPAAVAGALRAHEPPVFARVKDGRVVLDPRTLLEGEAEVVVQAFAARVGR